MTAEAPERPTRARPVRRGPADLPFAWDAAALASAAAEAAAEPGWLREARLAAAERYDALPVEANQLYTPYVDLRGADLSAARPYVSVDAVASTVERLEDASVLVELEEDRLVRLVMSPEARDAGVVAEPFATALARDPDELRIVLDAMPALPDDKLVQLTAAAWCHGLHVHVPDGVRLDRPILVRTLLGRPDTALFARTLVRLGDGATASFVEELLPSEEAGAEGGQALYSGTTEVALGAGARLEVASIQELGPRNVAFQHRLARVGEAADLRWALAQLGARLVRSRVDNELAGDRSSVEQVEIVFGSDEQLFDLTAYTRHTGRDTTGNLLAKGALLGGARSFMKGLITIERSAVGTDSFLGEFGMNLSKRARAVAIPSLEIDQPDCRRAAHSSSVGPIDESQVFYLESRGIPRDEARKFIVLGFLEPVVARVAHPAAQARLRERLEAKWDAAEGAAIDGRAPAAA
ncbi:MAG TPA: SufD family Fe-S cluster assembly protein [Candidatus Dormibacteraeota bacterium]|nr:SufD family Fe-S cluster assembly protein [Candidatus Dormibacteraeota bacterium]